MCEIAETKSYRAFVCTADKCPDTCCKDWDIVIDDGTLDFYQKNYPENITVDRDGDNLLKFENGVCPLLANGLCSVQTDHGHDRLCKTCREFPRITQDYTEFEERMLTLACPEAARLTIIENESFDFLYDRKIVSGGSGYDNDMMNFLLEARRMTAQIFGSDTPFFEKLRLSFAFTRNVQRLINDDDFNKKSLELYDSSDCRLPSRDDVFDVHIGMDVMDESWAAFVQECRKDKMPLDLDGEFSRLFLYYIARYFLTAIASYDVMITMIRAFCAALVCGALITHDQAENDEAKRALIYQKYSKEIEHSDENEERLAMLIEN